MIKLSRIAAVLATLVVTATAVGCSTKADDSSPVTDDSNNLNEAEAPLARFKPYMSTLKSTLESGQTNEQIANALLGSGRPAAFSLQALCKIYADTDDQFKTIRDDFKRLEDGVGNYDKWNGIYEAAVSAKKDQATLDRLKGQRDTALTAFTQMLTDAKFLVAAGQTSRLSEIQAFLDKHDWGSRKDDRALVLKEMMKELKDIHETQYDMKILEVGNGIHELRRDIRWILIEQLGLAGMITANEKQCAIPAYSKTASDGRYGNLQSSPLEPSPCQVDACVVYQAAKTVNDLGDLKDQAEQEVNINGDADVVPERLQPAAKAIYDDITKNDLIGKYIEQLQACKDAL